MNLQLLQKMSCFNCAIALIYVPPKVFWWFAKWSAQRTEVAVWLSSLIFSRCSLMFNDDNMGSVVKMPNGFELVEIDFKRWFRKGHGSHGSSQELNCKVRNAIDVAVNTSKPCSQTCFSGFFLVCYRTNICILFASCFLIVVSFANKLCGNNLSICSFIYKASVWLVFKCVFVCLFFSRLNRKIIRLR